MYFIILHLGPVISNKILSLTYIYLLLKLFKEKDIQKKISKIYFFKLVFETYLWLSNHKGIYKTRYYNSARYKIIELRKIHNSLHLKLVERKIHPKIRLRGLVIIKSR